MNNEIIEKLKVFCEKNKVDFKPGNRNHSSVAITGYALHLGIVTYQELFDYLRFALSEPHVLGEKETVAELKRIFAYGKRNNYGKIYA